MLLVQSFWIHVIFVSTYELCIWRMCTTIHGSAWLEVPFQVILDQNQNRAATSSRKCWRRAASQQTTASTKTRPVLLQWIGRHRFLMQSLLCVLGKFHNSVKLLLKAGKNQEQTCITVDILIKHPAVNVVVSNHPSFCIFFQIHFFFGWFFLVI